jgi:hypothetical protein
VSSAAPWAELVVLAERERDLAREGQWEEALAISTRRLSAAEALGDPPADARPHLKRLVELQAEITAGLTSGLAFTAGKLGRMERGRSALRGYGAAFETASSVIDGRG